MQAMRNEREYFSLTPASLVVQALSVCASTKGVFVLNGTMTLT